MATDDLNDSILIPNKTGYYDPAHELYQIFAQQTAHLGGLVIFFDDCATYIVKEGDASPTDTKRLNITQQSAIHNSEYVY